MPNVEFGRSELIALKSAILHSEIERPDEIPPFDEWRTKQEEEGGLADIEAYEAEFSRDRALLKLMDACGVCGSTECDRGVSWIGSAPIHSDQHPEVRAERAMDNRGRY